MKEFSYIIKDEIGLHARPAGKLSALAKEWQSEVIIEKGGKEVNASRLMMLMSLGIKNGDEVRVVVTGEDEEEALDAIKRFFEETL
ncbi:MAG: HPr family phosphocarrier protein [Clostridia bacterium]|nr:HPr family phosphocarrier protein [Clostridia bacterium]